MMACKGNEIRERYPDKYLSTVDTAIESTPMVHFHPRGKFLQLCTVGCNFNCYGCVSDILAHHFSAIHGAFQQITQEGLLIEKARAEACVGIMFYVNEQTVSYFTFLRLARMAKKAGLLMGCSTNTYLTEAALQFLAPYLDFVKVRMTSTWNFTACPLKKAPCTHFQHQQDTRKGDENFKAVHICLNDVYIGRK